MFRLFPGLRFSFSSKSSAKNVKHGGNVHSVPRLGDKNITFTIGNFEIKLKKCNKIGKHRKTNRTNFMVAMGSFWPCEENGSVWQFGVFTQFEAIL